MGMSTHVVGIKPPDDTWQKMKNVWDACQAAGVTAPSAVLDFFEGPPDSMGVKVDIEPLDAVREWKDDMREGFEIYLPELPSDIKVIRFYNSY